MSTYKIITDSVGTYRGWAERWGPVLTFRSLTGPTVMISDPELVREVFANRDPECFDNNVPDPLDALIGRRSMLYLVGDEHQRERKLLAPPFRGERMRRWASSIVESARAAFAAGPGELRALERMQHITLDVIVRIVFGVADEHAPAFFKAIREMMEACHPSIMFARQAQRDLMGLLPYKRFRLASEHVDELCYAHIDRVRAQLREQPGSRDDILAMMIESRYDDGSAMSNDAIRDELRTLLLAGHETTATTLAWALFFIHRDPKVLERVLEDVDEIDPETPDHYARLPYLEAVIDETLRMRPVAALCYRRLRKDFQLGEWRIPAGTTLAPAMVVVHNDPAVWPEPERFRPERFLDRRPAPHEFFPFGGGVRRCLGATFAHYEAAVVLATVLREFEFELLEREVAYGREKLTLGPVGGVKMRLLGRRDETPGPAPAKLRASG